VATGEVTVHVTPAATASSQSRTTLLVNLAWSVMLIVMAVIFFFPFFWTVASSLKKVSELYVFPPILFPAVPQWKNYLTVLQTVPFLTWTWNSMLVVVLSTAGVLLSSSLAAYAFARFEFRGREVLFIVTLGTMMLPAQVTLIPQFILFHDLGWIDTLNPLWIPSWFGGGAFYIFLLRQFILSLPRELDEAAVIDGANPFQILWNILLPLCQPALATVAVISLIGQWGDFITPLIYLNSPVKFTLAIGLNFFRTVPDSGGLPTDHLLMAASVMTTIPPILLFFVAQRYFVTGIVMSGIKG